MIQLPNSIRLKLGKGVSHFDLGQNVTFPLDLRYLCIKFELNRSNSVKTNETVGRKYQS